MRPARRASHCPRFSKSSKAYSPTAGLRSALADVKRCYIPLARILRIDEIACALSELRGGGRKMPGTPADDNHGKVASLRTGMPRPK